MPRVLRELLPEVLLRSLVPKRYDVLFVLYLLQRRLVLPPTHPLPVHLPEKLVLHQLPQTNPHFRVHLQQPQQQVSQLDTHAPNLGVYSLHNGIPLDGHDSLLVHIHDLLMVHLEQVFLEEQFIDDDPERPDVCLLPESASVDLRRRVLQSPYKGRDLVVILRGHDFGKAVIGEFDMSFISD